jgi:tRNA (guanine6-N2)-methyltransferase
MDIGRLISQGTYERNYRQCTLKSSLNPAIAFAMVELAGIDQSDRVLDPCCGSSTILIERQLLKPAICIGVDIDPRALECAKQNIIAAGVEIELKHGDIKDKKFSDGYFTKIISNLPYGIHTGSRDKNKELYRFLADKAVKWLKVGGKAVFITNAKSLLRNSFEFNPAWRLIGEYPVKVGGLTLSIFEIERVS